MPIAKPIDAYKALSKQDVWIVRYLIATALLSFLCWQASLWTKACVADLECLRPSIKEVFEMLKSGIFWTFVVIIMGKGIVPIINKIAEMRFGLGGAPPPQGGAAVTTETTVTNTKKDVTTVTPPPNAGGENAGKS